MKNSNLRVVHKSLLYQAVENGQKDIEFLGQVLEAVKEKEKTEESEMKKAFNSMASKLCCGTTDEKPSEKETEEEILKLTEGLQKVEDVIVNFSKDIEGKSGASIHQELFKEVEEVKEKIFDLKESLGGEKRSVVPLWDTPNEQGNTALHLSISLKNPKATSLLLEYNVDPNVQDCDGQTPLHLACNQIDIEQATKLVKHKVENLYFSDNLNSFGH